MANFLSPQAMATVPSSGRRKYTGAIEPIAKAYQNDPRTALMQAALASGTSGAPLAQGGWAIPDGLARVVDAVAGGLMQKSQDRKYAHAEKGYSKDLIDAASALDAPTMAETPQYSPFKAAQVQSGPAADAVEQTGPAALAAQGLAGGTPRPSVADAFKPFQPSMPPMNAGLVPVNPSRGGAPNSQPGTSNLAAHYSITARSESGNRERDASGRLITSPAGAQGKMQVMPGTNVDPGFGVRPAQDGSDAERTRVGQDYFAAMHARYGGDSAKAWAAYNAGPGALDRRVKRYGDNWLSHMPAETQAYVAKNMAALGQQSPVQGAPATGATGAPMMQPEAVPEVPQAPTVAPEAPKVAAPNGSARLAMARRLLESGNPYLISMAQNYLDSGLTERQQAEAIARQEQYGLNREGYQAAMGDFTGARTDARQHGYQANRDATARNFQRETGNNQNQFAVANREDTQQFQSSERRASEDFTRSENAARAAADEKIQSLKNEGVKMPVSAQNDLRTALTGIAKARGLISLVTANPDEVGIMFLAPEKVTSRTSPAGVKMRAQLNEFMSQRLHDRSGAAVTVEEFARQRGWYPSANDDAPTITAKLSGLIEGLQVEQEVIAQMYKGSPLVQGINPAAPFNPVPSGGWGEMKVN